MLTGVGALRPKLRPTKNLTPQVACPLSLKYLMKDAVRKKKQELESCAEALEKDADQLSIEAEKAMSWELVAKANAFRASAVEKRSTNDELATAVINLENSKAALK